jgi:phage shock protein C
MIDLKHKRLYRSPKEAIVLGIAAGVGHYFEVDPVFVRLAALVIAALTHIWPAVLVYGVLFFVVPIDPAQDTVPQSQKPKDVTPAEHMSDTQNM